MSLASAVVDVGADITKFRNSVQKDIPRVLDGSDVSGAGQRLGTKFSGAFTGALKIAGGLAAAVGVTSLVGFGAQAVKTGIGTAAAMETADIAFTTMLGSAEKADTFIRKLADFAKKTPFDFPGLQTAASSLISIGIDTEKVIPIMTTLGDVTSGMGTGAEGIKRATVALQQMNAAGRIQAQDLNQLRDAGIPVYDLLSAAMGKTKEEVAALAQNGGLGKDALDAMMKALETGKGLEKFSGLMDKQSASLSGLWSTLKDTVAMGLSKAFTPLIPVLKKTIDSINAGLEPALKVMSTTFKIVLAVLKPIFKLIKFLSPLIMSLVAAWAAYRAIMIVTNAVYTIAYMWASRDVIMKALQIAMTKKLAAAQLKLNAALLANPIGLIVGALIVLGGLFVLLYKKSETFRNIVNGAWAGIKEAALGVVNWFKTTAWPLLQTVFNLWMKYMKLVWTVVKVVFTAIWAYIKFVFNSIKTAFALFSAVLTGDWSKAWNIIKDVFKNIWSKLPPIAKAALDKVVNFVKGLGGKIKSALGNPKDWLLNAGKDLIVGLWNGVKDKWDWLKDKITGLGKSVTGWAKKALGIKSPSKVFAMEIGAPLIEGIGFGMAKELPTLNRNLASSLNHVVDKISAFNLTPQSTGSSALTLPGMINSTSPRQTTVVNSERPIYTDTGLLLGWMREIASGEARIVFNTQNIQTIQGIRLG